MKPNVNNAEDLTRAIAKLEMKAAAQKKDIEATFSAIAENLKPMNLVKSGFRSVFTGEHKGDLLNALLGLGSGFLSRKLFIGKSTGFVGKTLGKAIQWGMAGLVSKNADKIKEKAAGVIDKIFKKNHSAPSTTPAPFVPKTIGR